MSADTQLSATPNPAAPARSFLRRFGVVLVVLLLGAGATLGMLTGRLWERAFGSDSTQVFRSTAGVVTAVRDLARLEGAEFQLERVISLTDKQSRLYGLVQAEDAILLVASGVVTAGVDLSGLREGDVEVDAERRSARFTLPSSAVLTARLDGDRTFVFRRETDLLADRKETLEAQARQEAERTLRSAAEEGGILKRSNDNVRKTVETLVRSLGFTSVTVEFRGAPFGGDRAPTK